MEWRDRLVISFEIQVNNGPLLTAVAKWGDARAEEVQADQFLCNIKYRSFSVSLKEKRGSLQ